MKSLIKILATAEERWEAATGFESSVGRKNVLQLIQLRWIAVIGQITTISIVKLIVHIP